MTQTYSRLGPVFEDGGALRIAPRQGEPGCLGSCPRCAPGYPPCLACRDELRMRLLDMQSVGMPGACWN